MNLKIKLNIAGQDLELTLEEVRELKAALDKLLPVSLSQLRGYCRTPALSEPPSPFSPPQYPTITCDATPPKVVCDGGAPFPGLG